MLRLLACARHVALALIVILTLVGCGGGGSGISTFNVGDGSTTVATPTPQVSPSPPRPPKVPVTLTVLPAITSTIVGGTVVYQATATFADGSSADVTAAVTWSSSNPAVAAVSNAPGQQGLASGLAAGNTLITAALSNLVARGQLDVVGKVPTSLRIVPADPTVPVGGTTQLQALAVLPDGEQFDVTPHVAWVSSAPTIASVSTSGLVAGLAAGNAAVSASGFGLTTSTNVTVSAPTVTAVEVSPADLTIALGTGDPLAATAVLSDGSLLDVTAQATWTSAAPTIATVDSTGRVQSVSQGQTVVTATYRGVSGTSNVTVTAPTLQSIVVSPPQASIAKGTTLQYHATGIFSDDTQEDLTDDVTWTSTPASVATIASGGLATGVGTGDATIAATLNGIRGETGLSVTPAALQYIFVTPDNAQIPVGYHQQYTATGEYTDGSTADLTDQVAWSVAPAHVLTISNQAGTKGLAQGVGEGPATVYATLAGVRGACSATGTRPIATGLVVTPNPFTLCVGMHKQYTATVTLSDGTSFDATGDVHWSSSDKHVAKVSNGRPKRGRVEAVGVGSVRIGADYQGLHDEASLTVVSTPLVAIEVTPTSANIGVGSTQQFTATAVILGLFRVDVTDDVLWLSSDRSVAVVSTLFWPGRALALAKGTTTVKAILLVVFRGSAELKVHP